MIVSVHDVAQKLLSIALGLTATTPNYGTVTIEGGRVGEGGPIRTGTFVEVADAPWRFEGLAAGAGKDVGIGQFGIIIYRKFAKETEREKEELHYLFEALYDTIKADPTLGGLAEDARVIEADSGFDSSREYWMMIGLVEVIVYV